MGKKAEAIRYAEESRGLNDPGWQIAQACEAILLSSGLPTRPTGAMPWRRIRAQRTWRRFVPSPRSIPTSSRKRSCATWLPARLAPRASGSPPPRTRVCSPWRLSWRHAARPIHVRLTRAARDYAEKQPDFALAAGLAALRWISLGHGYDITGADVLDAYSAVRQAAAGAGVPAQRINEQIRDMIASTQPGNSLSELDPRPSFVGLTGARFLQQRPRQRAGAGPLRQQKTPTVLGWGFVIGGGGGN
jgi:hypothetical protein